MLAVMDIQIGQTMTIPAWEPVLRLCEDDGDFRFTSFDVTVKVTDVDHNNGELAFEVIGAPGEVYVIEASKAVAS